MADNLKTFLVCPDETSMGLEWEMVIAATSPREAVELGAKETSGMTGLDLATLTETKVGDDLDRGESYWTAQEIPAVNKAGVIDWATIVRTHWVAEYKDAE